MIDYIPCDDTQTVRRGVGKPPRHGRNSGLTAIEVMVSLIILSVVAAFSLQAFDFTRRAQLEVDQLDFAAQTARDILNQLRHGEDWRTVRDSWAQNALQAHGASFEVQVSGEPGEESGVSNVEVTLVWIGPKGMEQQVFNTSVFDYEEAP